MRSSLPDELFLSLPAFGAFGSRSAYGHMIFLCPWVQLNYILRQQFFYFDHFPSANKKCRNKTFRSAPALGSGIYINFYTYSLFCTVFPPHISVIPVLSKLQIFLAGDWPLHRALFSGWTWPAVFCVKYVVAASVVLIYAVEVQAPFAWMPTPMAGTISMFCQRGRG
jgi:hypothetical protein